jgi:hypothetical protein
MGMDYYINFRIPYFGDSVKAKNVYKIRGIIKKGLKIQLDLSRRGKNG